MPTTVVSTIGSDVSRDYADLGAWKNDFGVGLSSDITEAGDNELHIAEVYNDNGAGAAALSGNPLINPAVTVDSTHYLVIRAAAGETTPLFNSSGDTFDGVKFTNGGGVMRVSKEFTRIQHIYFVSTNTGNGFLRCLRLNSVDCIVESCAAEMQGGNNDALIGFSNESGGRADFISCLARGSVGSPGLTGLTVGFWDQGTGETVALNCGTFSIDQQNSNPSPPPLTLQIGIGFLFGISTSYCENCWSLDTGGDCFDLHASSPSDYNASSDNTAVGSNSLINLTSSDALVDGRNGFYRPLSGSVLVNAGNDVSADWPVSNVDDITSTNHDEDGLGWEIGPYNRNGPYTGTGTPSIVLPPATGVGEQCFEGTGAGTLLLAQSAGVGEQCFTSVGAGTLPLSTATGVGELCFEATGAATLPLLDSVGVGELCIEGTSTGVLPLATATGVGEECFEGTSVSVLPLATSAGVGELCFEGTSTGVLPLAQSAGVGELCVEGTGAGTLPLTQSAGVGELCFEATGAGTLPLVLATGIGIVILSAVSEIDCVTEITGSYVQLTEITGSHVSLTSIEGSYVYETDVAGSYDLVSEVDGSYDNVSEINGDICA